MDRRSELLAALKVASARADSLLQGVTGQGPDETHPPMEHAPRHATVDAPRSPSMPQRGIGEDSKTPFAPAAFGSVMLTTTGPHGGSSASSVASRSTSASADSLPSPDPSPAPFERTVGPGTVLPDDLPATSGARGGAGRVPIISPAADSPAQVRQKPTLHAEEHTDDAFPAPLPPMPVSSSSSAPSPTQAVRHLADVDGFVPSPRRNSLRRTSSAVELLARAVESEEASLTIGNPLGGTTTQSANPANRRGSSKRAGNPQPAVPSPSSSSSSSSNGSSARSSLLPDDDEPEASRQSSTSRAPLAPLAMTARGVQSDCSLHETSVRGTQTVSPSDASPVPESRPPPAPILAPELTPAPRDSRVVTHRTKFSVGGGARQSSQPPLVLCDDENDMLEVNETFSSFDSEAEADQLLVREAARSRIQALQGRLHEGKSPEGKSHRTPDIETLRRRSQMSRQQHFPSYGCSAHRELHHVEAGRARTTSNSTASKVSRHHDPTTSEARTPPRKQPARVSSSSASRRAEVPTGTSVQVVQTDRRQPRSGDGARGRVGRTAVSAPEKRHPQYPPARSSSSSHHHLKHDVPRAVVSQPSAADKERGQAALRLLRQQRAAIQGGTGLARRRELLAERDARLSAMRDRGEGHAPATGSAGGHTPTERIRL